MHRSPKISLPWRAAFVLAFIASSAPATAETCQLSKAAILPVVVTPGNRILVNGSIKGQPAQFQVDTGAFDTTFDTSVFKQFDIVDTGRDVRRIGATGETSVVKTEIPDLELGNFEIRSLYQAVARDHFLPEGVYAVFGEDFFVSFDVDLDLQNKVINLFQYNACKTEPIYWSDRFSEADLLVRQNKIYLDVEINGKSAVAVLDTGASTSVVSWSLARRLGLQKDSPGVMPMGFAHGIGMQAEPEYGAVFAEIHVGDEIIKNPFLRIIDLSPVKFNHYSMLRIQDANVSDYDMLLGADFMKAHHVYIATQQGKMYFTYNGTGAIFPRPAALQGGAPQSK